MADSAMWDPAMGDPVMAESTHDKKQEEMDENTKGMLDAYVTPVDFTDKENIKPIVKLVKELNLQ